MLEIRAGAPTSLDTPLGARLKGARHELAVAGDGPLQWRARYVDDEGRVWRSQALSAVDLDRFWGPAKRRGVDEGTVASLASLRPVLVTVRAELPDGRSASTTARRLVVREGVLVRRWRAPLSGTLLRPAVPEPLGTVVLDGEAPVAAGLLASRGFLVLAVPAGEVDEARLEQLAGVPGAGAPTVVAAADLPTPPGVGIAGEWDAAPRIEAWQALLTRLGAPGDSPP